MSLIGIFGANTQKFNINNVTEVSLIEKGEIVSYSENEDGTEVTGITLASGATFQKIVFTKDSASYTQELVKGAGGTYINQSLNFRVESEELSKAHAIILENEIVAIVKKGNGNYIILGKTNGISTTASTGNGTEEDGGLTFTLTGKNLGFAANLKMSEADVKALVVTA